MRYVTLIAVCLAPSLALANDEDRGFLVGLIEDQLSSDTQRVRIDGFQGALSSRARIEKLTITDPDGPWLTLTDVVLDWSRSALFTGKLEVNSLTVAEINLERLPQPEDDIDIPNPEVTPFALPELPVSVRIGQLNAGLIKLGPTILGEPIEAKLEGGANLAGGEGNARIALERTDGKLGVLALEGGFVNASRKLKIDVKLREEAGGIATTAMGLPGAPALELAVAGEGPIDDFTANLALRSDNADRLSGTAKLTTLADGGRGFALDLGGDITPLFLPDYREFFGPSVTLQAKGQQNGDGSTELEALSLKAAAVSLEGAARIGASGLPERFKLDLDLADPDGTPVLLPLSGDPVRVASGDLTLAYDAAQAGERWSLVGTLLGLETPMMTATQFRLDGGGKLGRDSESREEVDGTVTFSGTGLAFTDAAMAEALGTEITGETQFDWVNGAPLTISKLALAGAGYNATGDLSIAQEELGPTITGVVQASLSDLQRFSGLAGRQLGGQGDVTWQGQIAPLSGGIDGTLSVIGRDLSIDQPEVDALLAGSSTVALDVLRGTEGLHLRRFEASSKALEAKAQGWLRASGPDLSADLSFPDLSALGQGRSGRLNATATLRGSSLADDIFLTLRAKGQELRSGIPQVDGFLGGETSLEVGGHLLNQIFNIEGATLAGNGWGVKAAGALGETVRDLQADLRVDSLRQAGPGFGGSVMATLGYKLADGIEVATLEATGTGLSVAQPQADSLLRGTTTLTTKASRQNGVIRLEDLKLSNPQLSASADAAQDAEGKRVVDLNARLANLALLVPGIPGPVVTAGRVIEENGQLTLDLKTTGPGGIDVALAGTAASNFSTTNLRITGQSNAALASAFLSDAGAIRAPLQLDLALNGAPALSALSGRVGIQDGSLALLNPPITLQNLGGSVNLAGGRATLDLRASSQAGGSLALSGPITLSAPYNGDLQVTLGGLRVRDPQLYTTDVSGRIAIAGPLTGGASITGAVVLEDTELRIPSTGLGGTSAIPDLRHIAEPRRVYDTRAKAGLLDDGKGQGGAGGGGPDYRLNIAVSAPNRVFIRGRGLDAELGGDFLISGSTRNIVPSGGLQLVRGRLDLLGKRFNFTEGQLNLEGSMVPTIRLVAATDTVDGTASVVIDGPADAPEIKFLSNPELPEEEVVARLLFGRGLTSLTPIQAAQLASAVATLTGRGGGGIVDRLRQNFGLDDFDVSASETGAASLRAGKYISDNAYVDLKVDSEGKSEVSINLDLTKSVTVRGRAAADGAAGVGIHYERDY